MAETGFSLAVAIIEYGDARQSGDPDAVQAAFRKVITVATELGVQVDPLTPCASAETSGAREIHLDSSDRARLEWCAATVRDIADLGRSQLGDHYPQAVQVVGALKRVLQSPA